MKTATLPTQLNLRSLAARGATVSGTIAPGELPRLDQAGIALAEPAVALFRLRQDEAKRCVVIAEVQATLTMQCQRCLGNVSVPLATSSIMGCVWTDDEAAALPASLEPLLVSDEAVLRDIVEEEILLALPSFPTHETECKTREQVAALKFTPAPGDGAEIRAQTHNPFGVLDQLKK